MDSKPTNTPENNRKWWNTLPNNIKEALKEQTDINFYNENISEYELYCILNIKEVELFNEHITNLNFLNNLKKVKKLNIGSSTIKDITNLLNLKTIRELSLHNTNITDFSPISNLKSLKVLFISSCYIKKMPSLTSVDILCLQDNKIKDITPLAEQLTNIDILHLGNNTFEDITPIIKFMELTRVELNRNRITDISHLTNLTSFPINNNNIAVNNSYSVTTKKVELKNLILNLKDILNLNIGSFHEILINKN